MVIFFNTVISLAYLAGTVQLDLILFQIHLNIGKSELCVQLYREPQIKFFINNRED